MRSANQIKRNQTAMRKESLDALRCYVSYVVGDCYVGKSNRTAIRFVVQRCYGSVNKFKGTIKSRIARKSLYRAVVRQHEENKKIFKLVMG